MVGYCKYCEIYLLDDSYLMNHIQGKKHISLTEGRVGT